MGVPAMLMVVFTNWAIKKFIVYGSRADKVAQIQGPQLLRPVVFKIRSIELYFFCTKHHPDLHRIFPIMLIDLIVIHAMRIREFQRLQLAHRIPPVERDRPALLLRRTDHPVKKIDLPRTFNGKIDGAALRDRRGPAGGVCHLGEAEAAIQDIGFFPIYR